MWEDKGRFNLAPFTLTRWGQKKHISIPISLFCLRCSLESWSEQSVHPHQLPSPLSFLTFLILNGSNTRVKHIMKEVKCKKCLIWAWPSWFPPLVIRLLFLSCSHHRTSRGFTDRGRAVLMRPQIKNHVVMDIYLKQDSTKMEDTSASFRLGALDASWAIKPF